MQVNDCSQYKVVALNGQTQIYTVVAVYSLSEYILTGGQLIQGPIVYNITVKRDTLSFGSKTVFNISNYTKVGKQRLWNNRFDTLRRVKVRL